MSATGVKQDVFSNYNAIDSSDCRNKSRPAYDNAVANGGIKYIIAARKANTFKLELTDKRGAKLDVKDALSDMATAQGVDNSNGQTKSPNMGAGSQTTPTTPSFSVGVHFNGDGSATYTGKDVYYKVLIDSPYPPPGEVLNCYTRSECNSSSVENLRFTYEIGFFNSRLIICQFGHCNPGDSGYQEFSFRSQRVSGRYIVPETKQIFLIEGIENSGFSSFAKVEMRPETPIRLSGDVPGPVR